MSADDFDLAFLTTFGPIAKAIDDYEREHPEQVALCRQYPGLGVYFAFFAWMNLFAVSRDDLLQAATQFAEYAAELAEASGAPKRKRPGRPKVDVTTRAHVMRDSGRGWDEIYPECIEGYAELKGKARIDAQNKLKRRVLKRRAYVKEVLKGQKR